MQFEVGATAVSETVTLVLRSGMVATIRITDPGSRIQSMAAQGAVAARTNLAVAVISSAGFCKGASLVSASATGAEYTVTIPRGLSLSLIFDGPFALADHNGNPAPRRMASLPFVNGTSAAAVIAVTYEAMP